MKKFFLSLAVLLLIFGVMAFVLFKKQQEGTTVSTGDGTSFPISGDADVDSFLTLTGINGQVFTVPDFTTSGSAIEDTYNPGTYLLGDTTSGSVSAQLPFTIIFFKSTGYFNVVLNREPLGVSRTQAEVYLSELLGMGTHSLCLLDYMVSVPGFVSEEYSGIDVRFSECEHAVTLP